MRGGAGARGNPRAGRSRREGARVRGGGAGAGRSAEAARRWKAVPDPAAPTNIFYFFKLLIMYYKNNCVYIK